MFPRGRTRHRGGSDQRWQDGADRRPSSFGFIFSTPSASRRFPWQLVRCLASHRHAPLTSLPSRSSRHTSSRSPTCSAGTPPGRAPGFATPTTISPRTSRRRGVAAPSIQHCRGHCCVPGSRPRRRSRTADPLEPDRLPQHQHHQPQVDRRGPRRFIHKSSTRAYPVASRRAIATPRRQNAPSITLARSILRGEGGRTA